MCPTTSLKHKTSDPEFTNEFLRTLPHRQYMYFFTAKTDNWQEYQQKIWHTTRKFVLFDEAICFSTVCTVNSYCIFHLKWKYWKSFASKYSGEKSSFWHFHTFTKCMTEYIIILFCLICHGNKQSNKHKTDLMRNWQQ